MYPLMVRQSIVMLACESVADSYWLIADLEEQCFTGSHAGNLYNCLYSTATKKHTAGLPIGTLCPFRNKVLMTP